MTRALLALDLELVYLTCYLNPTPHYVFKLNFFRKDCISLYVNRYQIKQNTNLENNTRWCFAFQAYFKVHSSRPELELFCARDITPYWKESLKAKRLLWNAH